MATAECTSCRLEPDPAGPERTHGHSITFHGCLQGGPDGIEDRRARRPLRGWSNHAPSTDWLAFAAGGTSRVAFHGFRTAAGAPAQSHGRQPYFVRRTSPQTVSIC